MFKDENRHYSLRKLSVGLASVLIGISFASSMNGNSVKADTVNSGSNDAQTVVKGSDTATKIDAKDDTNAIESNTESAPEASKKDPNAITQDIKQKAIKASEAVTKLQDAAETIAKGNAPEAAAKNATDGGQAAVKSATESTLKGANLIVKQQNTAVKDNADADKDDSSNVAENDSLTAKNNALKATVEAAKQGLETPVVAHSDGNETTLNVKGSKAIAENMLKEDKENQAGVDPAKSKLKMAALLTATGKKFNAQMLSASKIMSPANDTNGGFDSSWGTLNVNDWKGSVQGDYYQLTDYTGDANHVIVPNEADFEKAGISTSGKQVGVTSDLMHTIFTNKATAQDATVAFSKTDNKQVKAINANWSNTWNSQGFRDAKLNKFDGTNLDVSNVTDMSHMFDSNQISDLSPLANWKVDNVTDMSYMFNCDHIDGLSPLANWKVDNVTDMSEMFFGNQISDLSPLANWKVDNVTDMSEMFTNNQISDLSSLANWKVDNVTDMSLMFDSNQISDLSPLANWHVNNVTNMSAMFQQNDISDLSPLANWHVNNVTDMSEMFFGNQISDLSPLVNWHVNNVTDMGNMFVNNQISDLSPLANWHVNNVTNMMGMFANNQISDLSPLASWNVNNVTDMSGMFYNNQISDLSPLANWKVDNVTDMSSMFDDNISSIPTNTIQAKRVINFVYPAGYTGKKQDLVTQTVDVPTKQVKVELITKDSKPSNNILDWVTKTETPISEHIDPVYFQDYTVPEIKGLLEPDKTVITREQADIAKPINVTVTYKLADSNTNDAFALDSKNGLHEHANVNDNGGYDENYWGKINVDDWNYTVSGDRITINSLKDSASTGANDAVIVPNLDDFKLAGKDGGAKTVYISSSALGKTAQHKYYGLSKTNGNTFTTGSDISNAFEHNSNLTHADLNSLNTSSVTDMNDMFNDASSLTSLDVSNWDTGNVTGMIGMFNGTRSLTSLDVSNWDTSNVTDMSDMFSWASRLTSLDVSKWKTGKVINMSYMFNNASKLTDLDVSNWDTSKVTDMGNMFNGASSLTSLDVSNWDTGEVTNMNMMFNGASSLTSLNVSKWDTGSVTKMYGMFSDASSLTRLDVSNWDTSKVTDMSYMFSDASSLTRLDVSKWDTDKVTDMSYMFDNARSLALIVNGDKFADYLVENNFAKSYVDSDVKSVTTDNTKLLKLLTNDSQHNSATRTIVFTFPANYSPDLTKYHLTKTGNIYQIKQSADYDKPYLQGTVLINGTDNIAKHHIDTTKKNKLSDTWQPNYDKLVLAHKNADGTVSFDNVQLPQIPGYKTVASLVNPARALFAVSFMALPKPVPPVQNDAKPAKTVTPAIPATTEVAKPIKTEPKVTISATPKTIDLSNDAVATTPDVSTWQVADEPDQDTYQVSNGKYAVELPHISNAQLHVIANDSTKDSILFTYKGQNSKYAFKIKFVNGHYLLTTYKIKSGKLVKLIDYNFIKSSKMIDVIVDWIKLK